MDLYRHSDAPRAAARRVAVSLIAALLALICVLSLEAQTFKPGTKLRLIATERFDIIFPEASRRSAEALAAQADLTYERLSGLLGYGVQGRIPVVITPDIQNINAYASSMPYPKIVLFDTPMSIEWTTFDDALQKVFVHELTHVISLSTRGPFFAFLAGVFGSWVSPAFLNTPPFMVEGVTVSFESLDGQGRANDPAVKEKLRQAIHEGRFLTPFQAAEALDEPHVGNGPYEYGGLFSSYIQRRFGMDRYARLWQSMGSSFRLSFSYYQSGFYGIFQKVYDLPFLEVWEDFADSLALEGLEENDAERPVWKPWSEARADIRALSSGGGRIFWLEAFSNSVFVLDPSSGAVTRLFEPSEQAVDLSVSADGSRMLVSGYRYKGNLATAIVREYDSQGRATGASWEGVYSGRHYRAGIVAIGADLHANRIVYRDRQGNEEILLEGNTSRLFSAPAPLYDGRIAFLVAEKGERRPGIIDPSNQTSYLLTTALPDDAERWRYARDLRASEGMLYFSYDHDDRMYKAGSVTVGADGSLAAFFQDRDLSGGVHAPVAVDGRIWYKAGFADGDAVLPYPAPTPGKLVPAAPLYPDPRGLDTGEDKATAAIPFRERAYSGFAYLDPTKFWFPLPLYWTDGTTFRVDGLGIYSVMTDPTDRNGLELSAAGDWRHAMARLDLRWTGYALNLPFALEIWDDIGYQSGTDKAYRSTAASGSLMFSRGFGRESLTLSIWPMAMARLRAPDPGTGKSAYTWPYEAPTFSAGLGLSLSSLRYRTWRLFPEGWALEAIGRSSLPGKEPRLDLRAEAGFDLFLPARFALFAAGDKNNMGIDGSSTIYGTASFAAMTPAEYAPRVPAKLHWLAGAAFEAQLLDLTVQRNLSHLYFNRFFATFGWRTALYRAVEGAGWNLGGNFWLADSILLRTGAVLSAHPAAIEMMRIEPNFQAVLKVAPLINEGLSQAFSFGFGLSVDW